MNPQQKDPNVLSFMMQLVQQKMGDEVDAQFLESESNRLYDLFGDTLVSYFEPMLTDEQKRQFDSLVAASSSQDKILEFLMSSIQDLDLKIQQVLISFRDSYLSQPVA
jgi:hypothetical protein